MDRRKLTDTQGRFAPPADDFAAALHSAHDLFEAVSGGPLILPPALVDPVLAETTRPELAPLQDVPEDAA